MDTGVVSLFRSKSETLLRDRNCRPWTRSSLANFAARAPSSSSSTSTFLLDLRLGGRPRLDRTGVNSTSISMAAEAYLGCERRLRRVRDDGGGENIVDGEGDGDGDLVVSDGFAEDSLDDCARDLDLDAGTITGNSLLSITCSGAGESTAMASGLGVTGFVKGPVIDSEIGSEMIGSSTASIARFVAGSAKSSATGRGSGMDSVTDSATSSAGGSAD